MQRRIAAYFTPTVRSWLVMAAIVIAGLLEIHGDEAPTPRKRPEQPLPAGIKVIKDVSYVPDGGAARTLDLYVPEKAGQAWPLLVWVHGGGWRGGSKDGDKAFVPLLAHGYAVASINYRLTGEAPFPAQIFDCKAAIRFLRAHAKENGVNPALIGVWGGSAGGHLVALLGTSGGVKELEGEEGVQGVSSRVQAVCGWFGPTDFRTAYLHPTTDQKNAATSPVTLAARRSAGREAGTREAGQSRDLRHGGRLALSDHAWRGQPTCSARAKR